MRPILPNWPADPDAFLSRMAAQPWRMLRTGSASGAANMALDVAMLEQADQVPPTFRLYGWSPPAVSLGRFQTLAGIDADYARSRGWGLVRRPTGGRAVLHAHELTYSIVLPPGVVAGAGVRASYRALMTPLHDGIRRLLAGGGFEPERELPLKAPAHEAPACDAAANRSPNCFALASECDTLVPQGKLVGSAQVRQGGGLLQHGSLLVDAEPEHWRALFGTAGRLVSLRSVLSRAVSAAEVGAALIQGFEAFGIRLQAGSLIPAEEAAFHAGIAPLPMPYQEFRICNCKV